MKPRTATFLTLLLVATCVLVLQKQHAVVTETAAGKNTMVKNTSATQIVITYLGDRASFFRTFMPYATDPCNHLVSHKSFC